MPGQQHSDTPTTLTWPCKLLGWLTWRKRIGHKSTNNYKFQARVDFVIPRSKFRLCIKIRFPQISRIFNASCLQEGVGAGTRACTNNAPVQASASTYTCTSPPPREGGLVQAHVLATTPRSKHTCLHPRGPPAQAHMLAPVSRCQHTCLCQHLCARAARACAAPVQAHPLAPKP
jgi:hypothetical protein